MMEENLMIEQAKTIYACLLNDVSVNSLGLALPWDDLTPEAQKKYIDLANNLAINVLAKFEETLFRLVTHENDPFNLSENEFYVEVIASREQISELYNLAGHSVTPSGYKTLVSAAKFWHRANYMPYSFPGYKPILQKIAQQTEGSTYTHKEVTTYAHCMLSLWRNSHPRYFDTEITALLQTMSLFGLSHFSRSLLAKEILELLGRVEERADRLNAENRRDPDFF